MSLRRYVQLWVLITAVLAYESWALNSAPELSLSARLKAGWPQFKDLNLSPDPGRPISLALGWGGIALISLTNLYVLKKRFARSLGNLSGWLNFHILCGLLGPTLIVFHCNFRVRGLVAVSFWSMIIVAVSGIVGRYLFIQVAQLRADLDRQAEQSEKWLAAQATGLRRQGSPEALLEAAKTEALRRAGGRMLVRAQTGTGSKPWLLSIVMGSLLGDLRLAWGAPVGLPGLGQQGQMVLIRYALARRRVLYFDHFKRYLGYWHAFHLPFAYFMYVIAVVHIATALLFGV